MVKQLLEATPERVAKLPAWAQVERDRQARRVRELEAEVAALRNAPGALDQGDVHAAVLDPYGDKVPVGAGHVEYTFPDEPGTKRRGKRLSVRFNPATKWERASVYVNTGHGYLAIRPQSGNAINLELHDD